MTRSMTAFARREAHADWGSATWELRSVNHRYLEVYTRLPEELRLLEPQVRELVGQRVKRGKVECNLRFQSAFGEAAAFSVNTELARELAKASREIDQFLYNPAPVHSMDVLRWPGVLIPSPLDTDTVGRGIMELLRQSLDSLVETRNREGEKIDALLRSRLDEMTPLVASVRGRMPQVIDGTRERIRAKLGELRAELDEQRVEQEIVIFAQKVDAAEELDRLDAHVTEVQRVLSGNKPIGRRLDFLMQELNREANTLASKSADAETTRAAVDLKVLIEQMREQVQNVE